MAQKLDQPKRPGAVLDEDIHLSARQCYLMHSVIHRLPCRWLLLDPSSTSDLTLFHVTNISDCSRVSSSIYLATLNYI